MKKILIFAASLVLSGCMVRSQPIVAYSEVRMSVPEPVVYHEYRTKRIYVHTYPRYGHDGHYRHHKSAVHRYRLYHRHRTHHRSRLHHKYRTHHRSRPRHKTKKRNSRRGRR